MARIAYRVTQSGEVLNYPIGLQTTEPHFGGIRYWFTCPLLVNGTPCHRRVQKLFLAPGSKYFGCRYCHARSYASRHGNALDRALSKPQNIRLRLGGPVSLLDLFPWKPKGMWERTCQRLCIKSEMARLRSLMMTAQKLGL